MNDEISALLSAEYQDPNSQEAMAMAQQLRGQLQNADFLSMSSVAPVAQYGANARNATVNAAQTRGRLNKAIASERRELQRQKDKEMRDVETQIQREQREAKEDDRQATRDFSLEQGSESLEKQRGEINNDRRPTEFIDPNGNKVIYDVDSATGQLYPQGSGFGAEPIDPNGLSFPESGARSAYSGRGTGWLTTRERQNFEDKAEKFTSAVAVIDSYKPSFSKANYFGKELEGVPIANQVDNFMARNAPIFSSEDEKAKAAWWQDWKNFYENPQRNDLFGAALTKQEQAQWANANINPSMTNEQIQAGINAINEIVQRKMNVAAENVRLKGADDDYISNNLQFITGGDDELQSRASQLDDNTFTMEELRALGVSREDAEAEGLKVLD